MTLTDFILLYLTTSDRRLHWLKHTTDGHTSQFLKKQLKQSSKKTQKLKRIPKANWILILIQCFISQWIEVKQQIWMNFLFFLFFDGCVKIHDLHVKKKQFSILKAVPTASYYFTQFVVAERKHKIKKGEPNDEPPTKKSVSACLSAFINSITSSVRFYW